MERIQVHDIHVSGMLNNLTFEYITIKNYKNSRLLIPTTRLLQLINETVRLANIVPGVFRKALKNIKFKGRHAFLLQSQ